MAETGVRGGGERYHAALVVVGRQAPLLPAPPLSFLFSMIGDRRCWCVCVDGVVGRCGFVHLITDITDDRGQNVKRRMGFQWLMPNNGWSFDLTLIVDVRTMIDAIRLLVICLSDAS